MPSPPPSPLPSAALDAALARFEARMARLTGPEHAEARKLLAAMRTHTAHLHEARGEWDTADGALAALTRPLPPPLDPTMGGPTPGSMLSSYTAFKAAAASEADAAARAALVGPKEVALLMGGGEEGVDGAGGESGV